MPKCYMNKTNGIVQKILHLSSNPQRSFLLKALPLFGCFLSYLTEVFNFLRHTDQIIEEELFPAFSMEPPLVL